MHGRLAGRLALGYCCTRGRGCSWRLESWPAGSSRRGGSRARCGFRSGVERGWR